VSVWEVQRLCADDLELIAMIDRSERVDLQYAVVDGVLTDRPIAMVEVPPWDPTGDGPFSVAHHLAFCRPLLARGAALFGVLDGAQPAGLVVVEPDFEPGLARLAWLHVSRPYRRRGVAEALWATAAEAARVGGARSMYVSATPTGSAVGFYLSRGCRLAEPPHPDLLAEEPEDIHFVCPLA
jgi:ribosomal protein S18 acetylase RimI-like enzyme